MNIYPYVYRLDHPITGEFYIGVRSANKVPASIDLGKYYFTSSNYVKPRFHEFKYQVVAEFFDKKDAYEFEAKTILEMFNSDKCLNKSVNSSGTLKFLLSNGHNNKSREKMSLSKKGKHYIQVCRIHDRKEMNLGNYTRWLNKISVCRIHDRKEMDIGNYTKWLSGSIYKKHNEETKQKIRSARLNHQFKTVTCPHCNKSGKINGMMRYHFDNCKYKQL